MNDYISDSVDEREDMRKHVAKFVHDIRTPLLGISTHAEEANSLLLAVLASILKEKESGTNTSEFNTHEIHRLVDSLKLIEAYTEKGNELVNNFWSETSVFLSRSPGDVSQKKSSTASVINYQSKTAQLHRILLVDDNEVNQQVGLEMLKELGFEVITAFDGYQALKELEAETFHLVLMDCRLPELDGWETTKRIRRSFHADHLPIVGITASPDENDYTRGISAGMNDCISKPLTFDALERIVSKYIN